MIVGWSAEREREGIILTDLTQAELLGQLYVDLQQVKK